MAIDLYSSCPCGSGKKFKWCCQPIHERISKAFEQDEQGQHETAVRLMEEVTRDHADNPEAWGRLSELLFRLDRAEEAETKLERAFQLNPNYAFGHVLKANFRLYEGEMPGALTLFRRATELYDPSARDILAEVYIHIFDVEMRLNRPIAARMAGERARNLAPSNAELRAGLDTVFGPENNNLPAAAKKDYRFLPAPGSAGGERRAAWDRALGHAGGKLTEAAAAFQALVKEDESDAPAWYNLALVRAWEGNNHAAVDALERHVALEADADKAGAAWALAEVLLCSQGMEDRANQAEHSIMVPLANPQQFVQHLGELEQRGGLVGARVDQEQGILTAILVEQPGPALTPELEAKQSPRFAAHMILMGNMLRLMSTAQDRMERAFQAMEPAIGPGLSQVHRIRGPVKFQDVIVPFLIFPRVVAGETEAANALLRQHLEKEFEETWVQQPLRSLGGVPPLDAAGHAVLSRKLRGVVQFIEDCAQIIKAPYDFSRLRRKLNLASGGDEAAAPADISSMNVAELAGLDVRGLAPEQLEEAFHAALKLDAREVAGQFAQELVSRSPPLERPDRFPLYNHLVQLAQARGDVTSAIDQVNEGERVDCEHNEGRRRNDYELRRGQLHARGGQVDQAQEVFERLIARVPDELRYRVSAAEAMLSARQGSRAKAFAQGGLDASRKQNNRDLEGHFQELMNAAEKTG